MNGHAFLMKFPHIKNMLLSQLIQKLKHLVPSENGLSDDLYGLQFGSLLTDPVLHKIILCVDPSKNIIRETIKLKSHFIISHHGITWSKTLYFNDLLLDALSLLASNQIMIFVAHTALDAASEGISECYAKAAGFNVVGNFYVTDVGKRKPIGRIGIPLRENISVRNIAENLKRFLNLPRIRILGNPNAIIKKAVIIAGNGLRAEYITEILSLGCDTFVSGEFGHYEVVAARDLGLNLIESSHFKSEKIGMENLQRILSLTFPRDEFLYIDSEEPMIVL